MDQDFGFGVFKSSLDLEFIDCCEKQRRDPLFFGGNKYLYIEPPKKPSIVSEGQLSPKKNKAEIPINHLGSRPKCTILNSGNNNSRCNDVR